MKDVSLTGIKFKVDSASIEQGTGTKYIGRIGLVGHFNREDLWQAIVRRLDGIEMHKGGDLQSELIILLQGQIELLEQQVANQGNEDRARAQVAEQEASLAKADLIRTQQHVQLLQAQLEMRHNELRQQQGELKQWAEWYAHHQGICPSIPR